MKFFMINMEINNEVKEVRKLEFDINPIFVNRWSPRSMTGEEMTESELMPLFEAARWAPSSMNNQLWRFIFAKRNTPYWENFLKLLFEGNQVWCKNAAALVIVISRKLSYHKDAPQPTHSLEAGAAYQNLALEGSSRGYVVHGMAGFDYSKAKELLKLPDVWKVECMAAIGKRSNKENLPTELQEREIPSDRKPLGEVVFEGEFKDSQ
jgi:nitroreductase